MKRYFSLALLFAVVLTSMAFADDFVVDISVSPAQVTVGDEVTIVYTLSSIGAHSMRIDAIDEEAEAYFVKEQNLVDERNLMGVPRLRRVVKLVPFETGVLTLPTTIVESIDAKGASTLGSAPSAVIHVLSVSPGENGPEEVKEAFGIIPYQEEEPNIWLWVIIGVCGLAIASLFVWMLFRAKTPASLRELAKLTPAERALEELNKLRKSDLLKHGLFMKFYTRLAFILKRYLGLRYHVMALEMTSAELSSQMGELWRESEANIKQFDGVMNICDLTKFAKFTPESGQGVGWIDASKQIILDTRDDMGPEKHKDQGGGE
jgi:hypothetical protein